MKRAMGGLAFLGILSLGSPPAAQAAAVVAAPVRTAPVSIGPTSPGLPLWSGPLSPGLAAPLSLPSGPAASLPIPLTVAVPAAVAAPAPSAVRVTAARAVQAAAVPAPARAAVPAARGERETLLHALGKTAAAGLPAGTLFDASRMERPASEVAAVDAGPDEVRRSYGDFLAKLGFRDHAAQAGTSLGRSGLTDTQKKVLEFNQRRYGVMNAARELAAEVMAGLAEQGNSAPALADAAELAARLLTLQPLDPPSSLPAGIAGKDKDAIREWIIAVTVQKLSSQLTQVISDIAKTAIPAPVLSRGLEALREGRLDSVEAKELSARLARIKAPAERLLTAAYTDAEMGQTRYAGRALAASLVRLSRNSGLPGLEADLKARVEGRGLRLENFVGDSLVLPEAGGGVRRLRLRTGDILGERSGGREAAEITFGVRPQLKLWLKALRSNLLGHPIGLWANPKAPPKLAAGQPVRNSLKLAVYAFQRWLGRRAFLQRGYSHVGMAWVEEADGVAMAWAVDNYPNAGEGGIRKIGIAEEFAQHGPFLRLGSARFDAVKVWEAFQRQAAGGYRATVFDSEGGSWPSLLSPAEHARLAAIPKSEAGKLLSELNERAVQAIAAMLDTMGVGFAYGFTNEVWRAYCSSTLMLAYRMGAQFEFQDAPDHWHPLVMLLKKMGVPGAKDQKTDGRIIWPGSLFIDPKVAAHETAEYPEYREVGRLTNPYTIPGYVEMDPVLTRDLAGLVRLDGGRIEPDRDVIAAAIRTHLDSRASKRRAKNGYHSGAAPATGYSAGLDELLAGTDGD